VKYLWAAWKDTLITLFGGKDRVSVELVRRYKIPSRVEPQLTQTADKAPKGTVMPH